MQNPNFHIVKHPLIQHKLSIIRNKNCGTKEFREVVNELSRLLGFEATRDLPLKNVKIQTPIAMANCKQLTGKKLAIAPILRAGLGMLDGMLDLIPSAKVACIGMYRDPETSIPHEYFVKCPEDINKRRVILIDPMIATGGSCIDAVAALVKRGVPVKNMTFINLVCVPEGIKAVYKKFPDLKIYTAAEDDYLTKNNYIVPGLGDAGDRLFGTK
ncbi:uracil phosphoribosyltransferase [Acetilactobacillus jinshanensis]|uniref:Uracil phosphoribosyltransferase n=1 Tax=Acetilactobacillus jinshanensis TaxID=1720083 RepID=A0A4P6ZKG0_9LACO|nr:uracil phosphoribosyltransferase [Acetilactobacillus jinshanensis]QBP18261.1 uracil phosphoribosyltransferase [Acetilactobacillus jinshanensis]URL61117.1 uracil phosphoribosyltransferase [uncultured bacterium]